VRICVSKSLPINVVSARFAPRRLCGCGIHFLVVFFTGGMAAALAPRGLAQPPAILAQPQMQNAAVGANASFAISASGPAPLSYQWRKFGEAIRGATNSALALSNVGASDGGSYSVAVANADGSVESEVALLTVSSDAFGTRVPIPGDEITTLGSTVNATKEAGEPNHAGSPGGKSIWWTWTAPRHGKVVVDTIGSSFSTLLGIYSGTDLGGISTLAGNEYGGRYVRGSKVTFDAVAGSTYHIAVDGSNGGSGCVVLHLCYSYYFAAIAGDVGYGSSDGIGAAGRFNQPYGIAFDSAGNALVADKYNHVIRKISPGGVVSTFAGAAGIQGALDGQGSSARFSFPAGLAVDANGNVFVADSGNNLVRKITATGMVTTYAGGPNPYHASVDGPGSDARFIGPFGIAADAAGNVFVTEGRNVRRIMPDRWVATIAGAGAQLVSPRGIAVDRDGNVFVGDAGNYTIRKITPSFLVSTVAGQADQYGSTDGVGSFARFTGPTALAVDGAGNLVVVDGNTVRTVTPDGGVTTLAGSAFDYGSKDGIGQVVRFNSPCGIAVSPLGGVLVADTGNHTIRAIRFGNVVTTLAGAASLGDADGPGLAARFRQPFAVAADDFGNVFVSDANRTIRRISPAGVVSTVAGMSGVAGSIDAKGSVARFLAPAGVVFDRSRNLFLGDGGTTVRRMDPQGEVTTLAGFPGVYGSADGTGDSARFRYPDWLAVGPGGDLYVADGGNSTIRRVSPLGVVTTYAGSAGNAGSTDGVGNLARFRSPSGIAADAEGNLFVADMVNSTIRKIAPGGVVSTYSGLALNRTGPGGIDLLAEYMFPRGVAIDQRGSVLVSDSGSNRIMRIDKLRVTTTIGSGLDGCLEGFEDAAQFVPLGICVDPAGSLYLVDSRSVIMKGSRSLVPYIHAQPSSRNAEVGSSVSFRVLAGGAGALFFQWRKEGVVLAGATDSVLTLTNLQLSDAGHYVVTVSNGTTSSAVSDPATLQVGPAAPIATQAQTSAQMGAANGTVTISGRFEYQGAVTDLKWTVLLPAGWSLVSSDAPGADAGPATGTTSLAEWTWRVPPTSPLTFSYRLSIPAGEVLPRTIAALASFNRDGTAAQLTAKPDPLTIGLAHSADTNGDFRIGLFELTRVIELYNTRNGGVRTGAYKIQEGTEDGFGADPTRAKTPNILLVRYHSADTAAGSGGAAPDGRLDLLELTRFIELYNFRRGTARTGEYHVQPGTEDGFAPGP
jgi:sugar lactone lactonase YvrE